VPNLETDIDLNSKGLQVHFVKASEWAVAFAAFSAIVLIALLLKGYSPANHLVGDGLAFSDWAGHMWTYWHYGQCLAGNDSCFTTGALFFPNISDALVLRGDLLFGFLFGLPAALWSMKIAWTLAAFFVLIGNGLGGYILVRTITGSRLGAALAGLVLVFCGQTSWGLNTGNIEYASRLWVCLFIAFLFRVVAGAKSRDVVLAGLFGAFAILSNFADAFHLPFFALILIAFMAWRIDRRRLVALAAVVGLVAILCAPVGWVFHEQSSNRHYAETTIEQEANEISVALQNSHSLGEYLPWNRIQNTHGSADTYFLLLALAILGAVFMRRKTLPWLAAAFVLFLLSLGPYLQIHDGGAGATTVTNMPLPFLFAHEYIPFYFRMQFPARIFSYALIALAELAGYGAGLLHKISKPNLRKAATFAIVLLTVIELFSAWKIHTTPDIQVHSFYESLRADKNDIALIEIPFNFANVDATYQYFQTVHQKPMFNGMFAPFLREDPTAGLLTKNALLAKIEALQQPILAPWSQSLGFRQATSSADNATSEVTDYSVAAQQLSDMGFRFLILHLSLPWENGRLMIAPHGPLATFLFDAIGPPVLQDNELIVFDLSQKAQNATADNVELIEGAGLGQ
jgi:hypothetical protein